MGAGYPCLQRAAEQRRYDGGFNATPCMVLPPPQASALQGGLEAVGRLEAGAKQALGWAKGRAVELEEEAQRLRKVAAGKDTEVKVGAYGLCVLHGLPCSWARAQAWLPRRLFLSAPLCPRAARMLSWPHCCRTSWLNKGRPWQGRNVACPVQQPWPAARMPRPSLLCCRSSRRPKWRWRWRGAPP